MIGVCGAQYVRVWCDWDLVCGFWVVVLGLCVWWLCVVDGRYGFWAVCGERYGFWAVCVCVVACVW